LFAESVIVTISKCIECSIFLDTIPVGVVNFIDLFRGEV